MAGSLQGWSAGGFHRERLGGFTDRIATGGFGAGAAISRCGRALRLYRISIRPFSHSHTVTLACRGG